MKTDIYTWEIANRKNDKEFKPNGVKVGDKFTILIDNMTTTKFKSRNVELVYDDNSTAPRFKDCDSNEKAYINWFRLTPYIEPTSTFTKLDDSKPQLTLIEPDFINGIANVLGIGAIKYSRDNWKQATPEDIIRFKNALLRHTLAYANGEEFDPESGYSHAYHIACNAMFIDYLINKEK